MAYDSESAIDIAALRTEIETDPISMGYGNAYDNPDVVINQLNDSSLNVGNETINKPVEEIDVQEIAGVIISSEYASLDEYNKEWVKSFIGQPDDAQLKPFQSKFLDVFASTVTLTNTLALRIKDASRAEALFGVNSVITLQDIDNARDSQ